MQLRFLIFFHSILILTPTPNIRELRVLETNRFIINLSVYSLLIVDVHLMNNRLR